MSGATPRRRCEPPLIEGVCDMNKMAWRVAAAAVVLASVGIAAAQAP